MPLTISCDFCGSDVEKYPYELEGKDNSFCDTECHRQFQIAQPPEEHNSYNGGKISIPCDWCGEENEYWPKRLGQKHFFCDMKCLGRFREQSMVGENNPNYKGGDWEHNYRGPNWKPARNEVRRLDGHTCQNCGATAEELGQIPDCHHITPEHTFEDRNDAHFKENLVLLCRDCHNDFDHMEPAAQVAVLDVERIEILK